MVLEVREEILRTQVNNKGCDGPRLVKGIVNEKTTYSEEKSRETAITDAPCWRQSCTLWLEVRSGWVGGRGRGGMEA